MILEDLGSSLRESIRNVLGRGLLKEEDVEEFLNDLQRSLIRADVSISLVKEITDSIREEIDEVPKGMTKKQYLVKITYEKLTGYLGKKGEIEIDKKPFKIMLAGLDGSGKTTTAAKIADYYRKKGYKVALLQSDTYRRAAYEQLKQLASDSSIPVLGKKEAEDATAVLNKHKPSFNKYDIVIIDTAGRNALNDTLISRLIDIKKQINPDEVLLTLPADIGKSAKEQADAFNNAVNIDGIVVTKLDGTAKGGGALTACAQTESPILFIGTGESVKDLERYRPKRFVRRLIGMGDLETLLEKAEEAIEEEEARDLRKRFMKGEFDLIDLHKQLETLNKFGPLDKVLNMIPGLSLSKIPQDDLKVEKEKLEKYKDIMNSMTKEELENPSGINKLRRERIARGAGVEEELVRELKSRYNKMKKMMEMFKGGRGKGKMKKMIKKMKKKGGFKGGGQFPF